MSRLRTALFCLCCSLGAAPAAAAPAPGPLHARILLPNRQSWDVELLGRFHPDRVLLKRTGVAGSIELLVSDVRYFQVPLALSADELLDQYTAGRFAEVADAIETAVQPYLPYIMDAPSNLDGLLRIWVKARYWQGDTDRALAACDAILSRTTSGLLHLETTAIDILCRVRRGQLDEAVQAAGALAEPDPHQPGASAYGYAMASLQLARRDLPAAQESLARIICFRSRDPEWMPPALLLSAEAYARAGQPEVAAQILDEVQLNYPSGRWAARAAQLKLDAPTGEDRDENRSRPGS